MIVLLVDRRRRGGRTGSCVALPHQVVLVDLLVDAQRADAARRLHCIYGVRRDRVR